MNENSKDKIIVLEINSSHRNYDIITQREKSVCDGRRSGWEDGSVQKAGGFVAKFFKLQFYSQVFNLTATKLHNQEAESKEFVSFRLKNKIHAIVNSQNHQQNCFLNIASSNKTEQRWQSNVKCEPYCCQLIKLQSLSCPVMTH